ncbi:hypothetical protein KSP39_PZI024358 [Platanthera zijinensis]|uniref:Uncharacterized protein n=1 Tax=Platanthera zijinensis TaxID=2320716 RepID=A0AAP0FU90_9ASPA
MQQVGEKQSGRKLQDLLQELANRGREEDSRWQPVLGSIMEVPEVPSFDQQSMEAAAVVPALGVEGAP